MDLQDQRPNPYRPAQFEAEDARKIVWENQDANIRTMQVIVFALAMGIVSFMAFTSVGKLDAFNAALGPLTKIGIVVALLGIPLSVLIPRLIVSSQSGLVSGHAAEADPGGMYERLAAVFQTQLIIACALLEGPGFMNVLAFSSERHPLSLLLAGLCIALLITQFPTKARVQRWIALQVQKWS